MILNKSEMLFFDKGTDFYELVCLDVVYYFFVLEKILFFVEKNGYLGLNLNDEIGIMNYLFFSKYTVK